MDNDSSLGLVPLLFILAVIAVEIVACWRVFTKAGQPGWAAIVPVYNMYILLKIAGRPGWWVLLFFIPIVDFIVGIIAMIDVAKGFGKGSGFGVGLALLGPIFMPILGFGNATYHGAPARA